MSRRLNVKEYDRLHDTSITWSYERIIVGSNIYMKEYAGLTKQRNSIYHAVRAVSCLSSRLMGQTCRHQRHHTARGIRYRAPMDVAKQRQQAMTQRGKRVGSAPLCSKPGIFTKRDISHIMHLVLNRSMAALQPLDCGCLCLRRRPVCIRVGLLVAHPASLRPQYVHCYRSSDGFPVGYGLSR
jgi:hypothetical protein